MSIVNDGRFPDESLDVVPFPQDPYETPTEQIPGVRTFFDHKTGQVLFELGDKTRYTLAELQAIPISSEDKCCTNRAKQRPLSDGTTTTVNNLR